MMDLNLKNTIVCPHCRAEYTLDEIYIANYVIGKSKRVLKDNAGKILDVEYKIKPDLIETYNCDYCKRDFKIALDLSASTATLPDELDFSKDEVSLI